MVESRTQAKHTDALREAIRSSLDAGATTQELYDDLTTILEEVGHAGNGTTVHVYEAVPSHLITITEAAEEHGVTRQAIYQWIEKGHIGEAGYARISDRGQRIVALLDRSKIAELVATRPHSVRESDLPIYDQLPPGLIDLRSAASKYDCGRQRLYNWIRRGHISAVARLRARAPGGGYLVVDEADVVAQLEKPRDLGGRPPTNLT